MTTSAEPARRWLTLGQQRHVLAEWRRDHEGKTYALTACGWLVWPSRHDARMRDPRVCVQCEVRHGDGSG